MIPIRASLSATSRHCGPYCFGPGRGGEVLQDSGDAASFFSSETVIGQPIAYPKGKAKVTAVIVTVPPGRDVGWHSHAVPVFGYMLDGELTVDYGDKGTKVYKSGDALLEAMNWPHNGTNKGTVPVRILAVYMGAEGVPNTTPVAR